MSSGSRAVSRLLPRSVGADAGVWVGRVDSSTVLAAAIDRELTDQAPWVPLFTPSLPDLTSARVGNYADNNGAVLLDQPWVR